MKKWFLFLIPAAGVSPLCAQLLQQDFNASSSLGQYWSASPGNGQFNAILSTGPGTTVSIQPGAGGNVLRFARAGANVGLFSRTTDLGSNLATLMLQFDLSVSRNSAAVTSAATFQAGQHFSTSGSTETNANVYARFTLNITAVEGTFSIRDVTNNTNSSPRSGPVRVTWVLNNSGRAVSYGAPDESEASLANDRADLWAGPNLLFNDVAVQTPGGTLSDLKFTVNRGNQAIDIDNLLVDAVPLTPEAAAPTLFTPTGFTANWTPVRGTSGYRLDVSPAADFSSFAAPYQNLYIPGGETGHHAVTGLPPGKTYYYRIRSVVAYSWTERSSGYSASMVVTTTVLPVRFTRLQAEERAGVVSLSWSNLTEAGVRAYEVQRSGDGMTYRFIGRIANLQNRGGRADYVYHDKVPLMGGGLYRVRARETDGTITYSSIVRVLPTVGVPHLLLFPNPATGPELRVKGFRLPAGTYTVSVYGSGGQLVLRKAGRHWEGSMSEVIGTGSLKSGLYYVHISGPVTLQQSWILR